MRNRCDAIYASCTRLVTRYVSGLRDILSYSEDTPSRGGFVTPLIFYQRDRYRSPLLVSSLLQSAKFQWQLAGVGTIVRCLVAKARLCDPKTLDSSFAWTMKEKKTPARDQKIIRQKHADKQVVQRSVRGRETRDKLHS